MFHEWKAQWWQSQVCCRTDGDCSVIHGAAAYAEKQAHLCQCLAQSCATSWLPILKGNDATFNWEAHYSSNGQDDNIDKVDKCNDDDDNDDDESTEGVDDNECSERGNNVNIDLCELED